VAAVVFGPTVKEGQVWYYMREALPTLLAALQAEASTPSSARTQQAGDVFEMLDQFFPDRHKTGTSTEAVQPGVSTPTHSPDSGPSGDEPGEDLSSLDQIDWEAPVEADWDTLAAATEQGIKGITFEEAQQQGLIPSDLTNDAQQEVTASSGQAAAVGADLPPVDSIDWQVSTETDWEAFIAGTDQGLDGIGFEEAKKRGLIDGLADGTETS